MGGVKVGVCGGPTVQMRLLGAMTPFVLHCTRERRVELRCWLLVRVRCVAERAGGNKKHTCGKMMQELNSGSREARDLEGVVQLELHFGVVTKSME